MAGIRRKPLVAMGTVLLAAMAVLLALTYRSEQILLKHRLWQMESHVAEVWVGLNALKQEPENLYERHRAEINLSALHSDMFRLSQWTGVPFDLGKEGTRYDRVYISLKEGTYRKADDPEFEEELNRLFLQSRELSGEDWLITRGEVRALVEQFKAVMLR